MKTPRTAKLPPFYTHVIGSLPRPLLVRDLLARRLEMSPERFKAVLDDLVRFAIRLQEEAGLDVVSDGEWRRSQYIREFLQRVGGFERCRRFTHQGETKFTEVVVRRMTATVGLPTMRLVRVAIGPHRLDALPPGAWRPVGGD